MTDAERAHEILRKPAAEAVRAITAALASARAEALEQAWRAAWGAEPLESAPVTTASDKAAFQYGKDCATAAIRALQGR